jgi:hypothetical protein
LIGYSLQGLGKYGFYELFKDVFAGVVGPENAVKYRTLGFALSSASAEIIADVLLCPWEAVNILSSYIPDRFFRLRSESKPPSQALSPLT